MLVWNSIYPWQRNGKMGWYMEHLSFRRRIRVSRIKRSNWVHCFCVFTCLVEQWPVAKWRVESRNGAAAWCWWEHVIANVCGSASSKFGISCFGRCKFWASGAESTTLHPARSSRIKAVSNQGTLCMQWFEIFGLGMNRSQKTMRCTTIQFFFTIEFNSQDCCWLHEFTRGVVILWCKVMNGLSEVG